MMSGNELDNVSVKLGAAEAQPDVGVVIELPQTLE